MENIKIAIIGAGPAGLSSAIELSKLWHRDIVVFEREEQAGGTPRHCGHLGFGIFEFYKLLSGPKYAKKLVDLTLDHNINIKVKHTLIDIENNILTFSTPNGLKKFKAQKIIMALGARETPRSTRLISGIRSVNIITTGAFQRFIYMQEFRPFKNAVIIGSEVVSFSALMTARHAGIKINAIIEENKNLNSFGILKLLSQYILRTPVKVGYKILSINGENKNIKSITISKNGNIETIFCDGIIFTGEFTPESAILQKSFDDFNYTNNSIEVSQIFQTKNKNIFLAGNVLRGALSAYNCYFEAKKVAKYVDESLKKEKQIVQIPIIVDENIQWYYPSLIDINQKKDFLTNLRMNKKCKGELIVFLNERKVMTLKINTNTYTTIKIPCINMNIKNEDKIYIKFSTNV